MAARFDVFISYKKEERGLADQVAGALEAAGFTQVTDLQLKEHTDADFADAITEMIDAARLVLVLWTPASAASRWVRSEARKGVKDGKYLGVMVEATDLPVDLDFKNYEDVTGKPFAEAVPQIVQAVTGAIGAPVTSATTAAEINAQLKTEREFFETIHALNSVAAYQTFLEKFPDGVLSAVARDEKAKRQTLLYRIGTLRAVLPSAAFIGACAGLVGVFVSDRFQENYWGLRTELREAKAALAAAPDAEAHAELQRQVGELQDALAAAPDAAALREAQGQIATLQDALAAAPDADAHDELQRRLQELQGKLEETERALASAADPAELASARAQVAALQSALDAAPDPTDVERFRAELAANVPPGELSELALRPPMDVPEPDCEVNGQPGYDFPELDCVPLDAKRLDLSFLPITDADLLKVAGLTGLQELRLSNTQVSEVTPLAGLTGLQTLELSSTQVSDVAPLAGLTGLQDLWLGGTQVRDVAPLAGLTGLQALSLAGTQVSDVAPIAGLTSLRILFLENTRIEDLTPLLDFGRLHRLATPDDTRLGNPLDDTLQARAEVRAWLEANT